MNQGNFEILERYYMNELDESQRHEVELRIQKDKNFRADAEEVELLIMGIQRFEEKDLRRKMKEWDNDLQHQKTSGKSKAPWQKWSMVAAAAVILISILFIFQSRESNTEVLFTQYYRLPPAPLVSARGGTDLIQIKKKAFEAFNNKNFALALSLFNEYPELEEERETRFYFALSLFEVGEHYRAIQQLENLNTVETEPVYQWYLALFYLHNEDTQKAAVILKELQNSHQYSAEATQLLNELQ